MLIRCLLASWVLCAAWSGAPAAAAGDPDLAAVQRAIIEQTNRFREANGLRPTTPAPELNDAARQFAQFMARTTRYGHEADGRQPSDRAMAAGYEFCLIAENIAYEYSSAGFQGAQLASRLATGWEQSPPHRHNMLDPDARETGVAVVHSSVNGHYYAVQMFGRRMTQAIRFRLGNTAPVAVDYQLQGKRYTLPTGVTRTHQVCRAPAVELRLPGEREAVTVRPADGERYLVERAGASGRLNVVARR
ncbi:CAP domain-containing protein [Ideonella sp. BN130291]|uniref:CAP domain-containing protein n=1 Tax=Ideonella sp. BN130291 TaxID=3112940 RepID=UPI002E268E66|nr:CAP domain-containing protein [Ideonella sp. BN130291]